MSVVEKEEISLASSGRHWLSFDRIVSTLAMAVSFVLIIAPLAFLFFGSFRSGSPGDPQAVFTFGNWITAYSDPVIRIAFLNTVMLSATVALISILMGSVIAWIVARTDAPGRKQLAIFLIIPLMISGLVTTLAWIALLAPNAGFINAICRSLFGIRTVFDIYSFKGMVLILVLHYTSFAFIPIYTALRSIDGRLEEASYMLGASPFQTAWRMTVRLVFPTLASTFLLIFIFVAENFPVPTVLGSNSGFQTLASTIFTEMQVEPSNPPLAAAVGTMLLWIALVGTIWQRRIANRSSRYVTIAGKGGQARVTKLGKWRYAATGVLVLYFLVSVVLPYAALVFSSFLKFVTPRLSYRLFTLDNYTRLLRWEALIPLRNSLLLGLVVGFVATFLYIFMAYLIRRSRNWTGAAMDYVALAPTVMPALVLAVGFVWTYIWLPIPIYGTIWILVLAYITRYYGYGIRQARAAFVQISDELSEAARMTGASPLRAFRDVMLPILRPAILSIWTMLFIFFFMEVSVTIMLYNPQTKTLPILLWESLSAGNLTAAFAVAVVESTTIFVVLYITNHFFGILRSSLESS